ncbi:MAG: biopolymer transporter ExbD [Deltaproteobacteria bacterium]
MAFDEQESGLISGINVTPLVDVMLVLLVIFMITSPMIQQGVAVDLPRASTAPLDAEEFSLVVSVTSDGTVYLNDNPVELSVLGQRLSAVMKERPLQVVYLRADRAVSYGEVVSVVAAVKAAGVERLGMITEP